jgi:hypothetical protein
MARSCSAPFLGGQPRLHLGREGEHAHLIALIERHLRHPKGRVDRVIEFSAAQHLTGHVPPGVEEQQHGLVPLGLVDPHHRARAAGGGLPVDRAAIVSRTVFAERLELPALTAQRHPAARVVLVRAGERERVFAQRGEIREHFDDLWQRHRNLPRAQPPRPLEPEEHGVEGQLAAREGFEAVGNGERASQRERRVVSLDARAGRHHVAHHPSERARLSRGELERQAHHGWLIRREDRLDLTRHPD